MICTLAALEFLAQLVGTVLHVEGEADEARGSGGGDGRELAAIDRVVEECRRLASRVPIQSLGLLKDCAWHRAI